MTRIADQYRIIEAGAGWIDRSARGRLAFEGRDARTFLQALVTNDIGAATAGTGVDAAYLTPQGRMIAMLRILVVGESSLDVEVAPGQASALATRFDQLIFAEQVRVTDASSTTTAIGVVGGGAAGTIARALAGDRSKLDALATLGHETFGDVRVVRIDDAVLPGYELWAPASAREDLISRLATAGAIEIDTELDEALRIDAGRPAFGVDMTEDTIPLEAGLLDRAISTIKGCYVGQEVIIRVLHRGGGRVARRLVKLAFDEGVAAPPASGTPLFADGREAGRVTSASVWPVTGRVIALGYVHRDAATIGTRVVAKTPEAEQNAEVTGFAG